ncbi:hypothetical protein RhiirA1_473466 [Rhizophagus irregularis]|uniref:Uncharacterized protein n=1 Tax=Rhizophagus irregularis TaxID=588596 RepID=A0A2I1ENU3_9GLOM|nr:hypothetical protein RhiirA1_473466 [Rhizophagus irregularis]PKY23801.1 hypothetical protein RhiirB3_438123 [Rhizophagus irregularis]CAB4491740.1 unnamed protein product [Rhizophagus irregularis]CAB5359553.1 unnamed protein product [Rhizophagus irregularis]
MHGKKVTPEIRPSEVKETVEVPVEEVVDTVNKYRKGLLKEQPQIGKKKRCDSEMECFVTNKEEDDSFRYGKQYSTRPNKDKNWMQKKSHHGKTETNQEDGRKMKKELEEYNLQD